MNLADAIRRATASVPEIDHAAVAAEAVEVENVKPQQPVTPEATLKNNASEPHPEPVHAAVASGNVVRLELFLSAEQMSGLLRAIMAGQHSVLTLREAATYLRIGTTTLERLAEEGEIPGVQIDGRWRFPKPNLDDWLSLQTHTHDDSEGAA